MYKTLLLFLLEITPLLLFFVAGQLVSFQSATILFIFATICSISIIWHVTKQVSYFSLILGSVIISAGSLSVWFHNPEILLLADTVYYLGAAAILGVLLFFKYNLFYRLFATTFGMEERGWKLLTIRWIIALILVGIGNESVRQLGTIPDWLWFQLVKTIILLLFATYQITLTKKYRLPEETNSWGIRITN